MKWILIVLITHNHGGIVDKQFNMPDQLTCEAVSSTIKEDLKRSIALEKSWGYGIDISTTCTKVPIG